MAMTDKQKKNVGSVAIGEVHAVSLWLVNCTYNHRVVFPRLVEQGYKYIELIKMGVSQDPKQRAEYVRLVEEFESVPIKDGQMTVIGLARNIREQGQLQPISVQQLGTTNMKDAEGNKVLDAEGNVVKQYGYGVIAGSHRVAALAFAFAKWGFVLPNNKGIRQPFVKSTFDRVDKKQAARKAMSENMLRKEPSEYEIGEWVTEMLANEDGLTLEDIALEFGKSVSSLKDCMAIYKPLVEGVDGKEVMEKLKRRQITKAEAVATVTGKKIAPSRTPKALRTGDGAVNSRRGPVNKVIPYAEVVRKIVETNYDGKPPKTERLRALGEVIGLTIDEVIELRAERLKKSKGKTA